MISKEEAREKIKKAGYNVVDDNSVLMILIPEKASVKNTVKAVRELLLKIDYQASFGVKQHSKSEDEMAADNELTDDEEMATVDTMAVEKAPAPKAAEDDSRDEENEFLDEEDENFDEGSIRLDDYDMDMMLNEKSIQFSLEDFGLI